MRLLHTLPLWLLLPFCAAANSNNPFTGEDKQTFIDTYADLAIQERDRSGIPASITLAQAILESDWGRSRISVEGNNFFCIKCTNWTGDTLRAPDDEIGLSCFRVYSSSYESFLDHTDFLMQNARYQPLFSFHPMDYEAWAYGLKECGYATDEEYGSKLVKIIQDYGLYVYDASMPITSFKILDSPVEIDEKDEWEMQLAGQEILSEAEISHQPENPSQPVEEDDIMTAPRYRLDGKNQHPGMVFRYPELEKTKPDDTTAVSKIRPVLPMPSASLARK